MTDILEITDCSKCFPAMNKLYEVLLITMNKIKSKINILAIMSLFDE